MQLRNWDDAIQDFTKAVDLDFYHPYALRYRGRAHLAKGDFNAALQDLQNARIRRPEDVRILNDLGIAYYSKGKYREAVEVYTEAIGIDPYNVHLYINRGIMHRDSEYPPRKNSKKIADALKDFEHAIELYPDYSSSYHQRGITHTLTGDFEDAVADYTKAIELNPRDADYYINRSAVYRAMEEYEKSLMDASKAIELNPRDADYYNNRSAVYRAIEEYEKALMDASKAVELNPQNPQAYNHRGIACMSLNTLEDGIKDFSRAIEMDPDNAEFYRNRGAAYSDAGQSELGMKDFDTAVEKDPDDMVARATRGFALMIQEKWNKAKPDLEIAANDPEHGQKFRKRFVQLFGGVEGFEKERGLEIPEDIRRLLEPSTE